jgi:hypothetical protein
MLGRVSHPGHAGPRYQSVTAKRPRRRYNHIVEVNADFSRNHPSEKAARSSLK